jgi:hypothetical protein
MTNSCLKILKLEKKETPGIFKRIKGRRFIAVSIDENGSYEYHVNHMTEEEAVFGCQVLINGIINEKLGWGDDN